MTKRLGCSESKAWTMTPEAFCALPVGWRNRATRKWGFGNTTMAWHRRNFDPLNAGSNKGIIRTRIQMHRASRKKLP